MLRLGVDEGGAAITIPSLAPRVLIDNLCLTLSPEHEELPWMQQSRYWKCSLARVVMQSRSAYVGQPLWRTYAVRRERDNDTDDSGLR